jgi:DNA-binding response OmpR family regulator
MAEEIINVLIIDDDEDDFIITEDLLTEISGSIFKLNWTPTGSDGLEKLLSGNYDLCLLDYHIGEFNGLDILQEATRRECDTPIIMLTGSFDREIDLQAMKTGAADYIIKGQINAIQLERSLRYALTQGRMQKTLKKTEMLQTARRLSGGIAHEFSQPLQVLTTRLSLMEMESGPSKNLTICKEMVDKISHLVDDLRSLNSLREQDYLDGKILNFKSEDQR